MMHRLPVIALAFLILSIIAPAAHGKDLNIGWPGPGSWTTLPFIAAEEKGFFQKEDLKVRMILFRGINVTMAALVAGEIDYATVLPSMAVAAARGIPVKIVASVTKGSSFALIARREINSLQALKGKKVGINSLGSSLDYVTYAALTRSGLDPNKDVTFLAVGGGTPDRIAALSSGSVDATVVTSPLEYTTEQQGFRTLITARDLANLVRIVNTGIGATQKKIEKEPNEIVRLLRALRSATLAIQEQREYGIGLFEKVLRFDRPSAQKFYGLFRDQLNPELSMPEAVVEDLLAVGTFRSKENERTKVNIQAVRDWTFAEKAKR